MSWVLHRIDDRLIHGQVLVAWGQRLDPARIWVVDDGVAASPWERDLFREAAPDIEVQVASVAEAAASYADEAQAPGGAFLLVRDLVTARRLAESVSGARDWNIGGLHYAPGKDKINDYVYLNTADRAAARVLLSLGATLSVQDVPASRSVALASLDAEIVS